MTEQDIIDRFLADEITAEQMVDELASLRPRRVIDVTDQDDPIPTSLVRAQAAIRRINRGR